MTSPRHNYRIPTLIIITLFGLLLRLYQLDWQCLMVDETVTAMVAAKTTSEIFTWAMQVDCNPPLYYLMAHWSSLLFGSISDYAIRFPSAIIGTLAIPLSYLVGKEIRNATLGLLSATIVSFLFPYVLYSQNARGYMLILVAFLGFTYFFVRMFNGNNSTRTTIGLALFTALCLWSHYYSIVPIGVSLVILFLNNKPGLKKTIQYCAVVLLAMLPLISLANFGNLLARSSPALVQGYTYSQLTPDRSIWITPYQMAIYMPNELLCWSWIILIPIAVYAACKKPLLKYFGIITIITCLILIPLAHVSNLMPRYAILVSPLIVFMAMYPIAELIDDNKTIGRKVVIFALVIFVIALTNYLSLLSWFTFNICHLI
jgi:uncharacterized membrane protein